LLNKSLAADRDPIRPAIVSSRDVFAQSCFDPFKTRFEIVTTMGDVPDSAGHEMTVGARDCSPLKAGFLTPKTHL